MSNPKQSPLPYDAQDDDELLDDYYSVASMTECTGLIPAGPVDAAQAASYDEIYDVPLGAGQEINYRDGKVEACAPGHLPKKRDSE